MNANSVVADSQVVRTDLEGQNRISTNSDSPSDSTRVAGEDGRTQTDEIKESSFQEELPKDDILLSDQISNESSRVFHLSTMDAGISGHAAALQQLQTHIRELGTDKESEINILLTKISAEHARDVENIKKMSQKILEEHVQEESERESKVLEENMELVNLLKSEHKEELEGLRRTLEDDYQKQVLKISDELRDHYQNDMDEKITKLEEDWEQEFIKQKRDFDERVAAVQKDQWAQCQEAIERVTLDAEDQLKNVKHAHERETTEHKNRIKELLEQQAQIEVKENELHEEKSKTINESFEKIKTLEKQLSIEREEVESQMSGAENQIKMLQQEHEKKVENLRTELEKKYSDILNEAKSEMKTKYQGELDEKVHRVESHLRQQYEEDLGKTNEELRESSTTLKEKYEKQLTEVVGQLEELHERNQQHELEKAKLKKECEIHRKKVAELQNNKKQKHDEEMKKAYEAEKVKVEELYELNRHHELEEARLKQDLESERKKIKELKEEMKNNYENKQTPQKDLSENNINDLRKNEEKRMQEILEEKRCLEDQLHEVTNQVLLFKENLKRTEREKEDLKSTHETKTLQMIKSYKEKITVLNNDLELQKASAEEVSKFREELKQKKEETEREREDLKSTHEAETLEIIKSYDEKIAKLNNCSKLQKANEDEAFKLQEEIKQKMAETEKEKDDLKSRHEAKILEIIKSYEDKIKKLNSDLESQKANANEEFKLREALKQEIEREGKEAELKSQLIKKTIDEVSKLQRELKDRKALQEDIKLQHESAMQKAMKQVSTLESELVLLKENEEKILKLQGELQQQKEAQEDLTNALEEKKASEEVVRLQNEASLQKLNEEISRLRNELKQGNQTKEEISRLQSELKLREATITELEETSRARELEIANLILHSPLPKESNEEFEYGTEPEDRIFQLENELAKYKKKVMELEEEAEDKFEITLCPNCHDGKSREEILLKANAMVEKIKHDCKEMVDDLAKKLKTRDEMLKRQAELTTDLEEKLLTVETELNEERRRSVELLNLKSKLDINSNVLHYDNAEKQGAKGSDDKRCLKDQVGSEENARDEIGFEKCQSNGNLMKAEDYQQLLKRKDREFKTEISKKDSEIAKKNTEISEKDSEISQKLYELSEVTKKNENLKYFVEALQDKLQKGDKKYEHLTVSMMDQKQNYESEIELMQKEIEGLIEENKKHENKLKTAEGWQREMVRLQKNIQEREKTTAESSEKNQEEITKLKKLLQEKERSLQDLKNIQQLLETDNKEMVKNTVILKKQFEDRETELLNKIRENSAMFDNEKNEILENGFQEKEELFRKINDLERSCKNFNLWIKSDGESEISINSNEDSNGEQNDGNHILGGHPGYQDLREHKWKSKANWGHGKTREDTGISENAEILQFTNRREGILGDERRMEEMLEAKKEYTGIVRVGRENIETFDDEQSYNANEFGDYSNDGYDSIFYSKAEEKNHEIEIELLVEKEEKERLREELETMSKCVDVFHDECQHLKNSLDKALDMISRIKEERDVLAEQSDRSLQKHSEIMADLIKNEEIIKRLESGNEKLEEEKEMLQHWLLQIQTNQSIGISRIAPVEECSTNSNSEIMTFLETSKDLKKPPDVKVNFDKRESDLMTDGLKKEQEVLASELQNFHKHIATNGKSAVGSVTTESWRETDKRNEKAKMERDPRNTFCVSQSTRRFLENKTSEKPSHISGNHNKPLHHTLKGPYEDPFIFQYCHDSNEEQDQQIHKSMLPWQPRSPRDSKLQKHVEFTCDNFVPHETSIGVARANDGARNTSYDHMLANTGHIPRNLIQAKSEFPKEKFQQKTSLEKNEKPTEEHKFISSKKTSQVPKTITRTPRTRSFHKLKNSYTPSRSFLTSTGANSSIKRRLVPNLSGLSPIVSPFERRQHGMLRWHNDDLPLDSTQEEYSDGDTTILTADPFGLHYSRRFRDQISTSNNAKGPKGKRNTGKHARSHSADERLFSSPTKISSLTDFEDAYVERPLIINFEDFVCRYRVKSSEDVANLRDPSPAEMWFS